jgi:hypothetical protein
MSEKSILEQALLQVQTLEEAVKANAKGILASTMKQELNELLKEEEEEEVKPEEEETSEPEKEEKDVAEQPEDEDDSEEESDDEDESADDEDLSKDVDSMDSGDDLSMDTDTDSDTMDDELPMGDDDMSMGSDDDDVMDLTSASDEEVLKVFKAMKPEDGVVVKKDGDDLELELDGDEYIIKLDGEDDSMEETSMDEISMDEDETVDVDSEMEEETLYEIELDEDDEESKEEEAMEEKDGKEIEAHEAARTQGNDVRGEGPRQGKKFKAGRPELNEEVSKLKKQNDEYKKALVLFKEKLNEVAVFNANLAYATRLFTEHSTTKQEKLNILKRFDSVSTMNESKNLFKTIKSELVTKKPVTESVVEKITTTPQTSSSKEVLAESKAYENPQFRRMKDLMSKIK